MIASPQLDEHALEQGECSFDGEFDVDRLRVGGGDCAGANGHGSISESILSDVDLTGAELWPLRISDTRMNAVDLSNTSIQEANLRRVEWLHLRAIGLRLSAEQLEDAYFEEIRFDYATIHIERVRGIVVFRGCSFREAELSGDLSDTVFDECEFTGAQFTARVAKDTDLRTSRLEGARGLLSLRGARVTATQAISIADQLAAEAGLSVED